MSSVFSIGCTFHAVPIPPEKQEPTWLAKACAKIVEFLTDVHPPLPSPDEQARRWTGETINAIANTYDENIKLKERRDFNQSMLMGEDGYVPQAIAHRRQLVLCNRNTVVKSALAVAKEKDAGEQSNFMYLPKLASVDTHALIEISSDPVARRIYIYIHFGPLIQTKTQAGRRYFTGIHGAPVILEELCDAVLPIFYKGKLGTILMGATMNGEGINERAVGMRFRDLLVWRKFKKHIRHLFPNKMVDVECMIDDWSLSEPDGGTVDPQFFETGNQRYVGPSPWRNFVYNRLGKGHEHYL